jgi:hypothetical protein
MPVSVFLHRTLLCRSSLLPDESLWSYLNRLAAANCYEPPSMLTKLCEKRLAVLGLRDNLAYPKRPETFDVLASLTRLTPRELANASVHYFAQAPVLTGMESPRIHLSDDAPFQLLSTHIRSRYLLRADCAQFCPDCLREAAYHRRAWMLTDVLACVKHRRLLLNRCQKCHSLVQVQDIVRCQCSECGADFTNVAMDRRLEPFGLFAQRTVWAWWGLDTLAADSAAWPLPEQPPYALHHLFRSLADSIGPRALQPSRFSWTPSDRYKVQSLAFKALTDWPTGFCDFLRACLEHDVGTQSRTCCYDFSEPIHLGNESSLAFWICGFQHWPGLGFVQEAIDRFLAENNVQVCSDCQGTHIRVKADEDIQRISRFVAQRALERLSRIVEAL